MPSGGSGTGGVSSSRLSAPGRLPLRLPSGGNPPRWLVDRERRVGRAAETGQFESFQYITFVWQLPLASSQTAKNLFYYDPEGHEPNVALDRDSQLSAGRSTSWSTSCVVSSQTSSSSTTRARSPTCTAPFRPTGIPSYYQRAATSSTPCCPTWPFRPAMFPCWATTTSRRR